MEGNCPSIDADEISPFMKAIPQDHFYPCLYEYFYLEFDDDTFMERKNMLWRVEDLMSDVDDKYFVWVPEFVEEPTFSMLEIMWK